MHAPLQVWASRSPATLFIASHVHAHTYTPTLRHTAPRAPSARGLRGGKGSVVHEVPCSFLYFSIVIFLSLWSIRSSPLSASRNKKEGVSRAFVGEGGGGESVREKLHVTRVQTGEQRQLTFGPVFYYFFRVPLEIAQFLKGAGRRLKYNVAEITSLMPTSILENSSRLSLQPVLIDIDGKFRLTNMGFELLECVGRERGHEAKQKRRWGTRKVRGCRCTRR